MNTISNNYQLSNGQTIPVIGFGTWQAPDGVVAEKAVTDALAAGYRHIDTAAIYKNEASVGRAIKNSGIRREDLFITTKLWNDCHTFEKATEAIDDSLDRLGIDYIDLYLIHWPNPLEIRGEYGKYNAESWRAMEAAVKAGKIKSIGVSNFRPHHLKELLKTAKVKPVVNQIFLNPSDHQSEVVEFCQEHDILLEAYSPLGTGEILTLSELNDIAKRYKKTSAQVVLRWSLQKGFLPLPKSVTKERIKENLAIFDFELSKSDMKLLDQLEGKAGFAKDPDNVSF